MSVSARMQLKLTVVEALDLAYLGANAKSVTHSAIDLDTGALTSTTSVPATDVASFSKALSTGTGTIDLTALDGTEATINGTGKKVQAVLFRNPSTNANAITIVEGASNGYELLGNAWSIVLQPGQQFGAYLKDAAPDIGASAKTIDISGTGSQALDCVLVIG